MSKFEVKSTLGKGANEAWEPGAIVSSSELGEDNIARLLELGVIVALDEPAENAGKKRGVKN